MRISLHVKTNLNYDGRVLASIDAISRKYPEGVVKVALLPDASIENLVFPPNVFVEEISVPLRDYKIKKIIRPLSVLFYALIDLRGLIKFKPDVVHIHDNTACFGPFIYRLIKGHKIKLIYDDHEVFNRPKSLVSRLLIWFEGVLSRRADMVVVANNERARIIKKIFGLNQKPYVLENYFYDRHASASTTEQDEITTQQLTTLRSLKEKGCKLLLHQGRIIAGRGKSLLELFPPLLPSEWKLCIIGLEKDEFDESSISTRENVLFLGKVKFDFLPRVYDLVDGAIVFYKGDLLNNRYCAPNRFYQALANGLPLIVNSDNPFLSHEVGKRGCGLVVSEDKMSQGLVEYFSNFSKLVEKARSSKSEYSSDQIIKKYIQLYNRVENI
jgi:glycosyltransferase involved in cell wall biosynthesis